MCSRRYGDSACRTSALIGWRLVPRVNQDENSASIRMRMQTQRIRPRIPVIERTSLMANCSDLHSKPTEPAIHADFGQD